MTNNTQDSSLVERIAEDIRGAASDCNVQLECDQQVNTKR